jgi:hypothetical protein
MMDSEERDRQHAAAVRQLARRLAAAYTSYIVGHAGVDRMLKRCPEQVGPLWMEIAELLFRVASRTESIDQLKLSDVVSKYIQ